MPGVTLKTTKANNIDMRYAEVGSGPLVLFCHGWPESWYSWRHQLTAVSAAGFRCVAPDMRGYGGTEAPQPVEQYTLHHMVGDMAELVKVPTDNPPGNCQAHAEKARALLQDLGFAVESHPVPAAALSAVGMISATNLIVRACRRAANLPESSSSAATPVPLSFAPGHPATES